MLELLKDYELDEITTTGDIAAYSTPFAFKKKKKKKKKSGYDGGHESPDVFGFSKVNEELSQQDVGQIKKIIKGILTKCLEQNLGDYNALRNNSIDVSKKEFYSKRERLWNVS